MLCDSRIGTIGSIVDGSVLTAYAVGKGSRGCSVRITTLSAQSDILPRRKNCYYWKSIDSEETQIHGSFSSIVGMILFSSGVEQSNRFIAEYVV